jgi:hypothetical protein
MTGKCLRQVEHVRGYLWHRYSVTVKHNQVIIWFRFMVLNITLNNISVISAMSWLSVLLVEETAVPGKNHRPVAYHIMLYRVHLAWVGFDLTTLVVVDTDYTGSLNQTTIRSRPRRSPSHGGDLKTRSNDFNLTIRNPWFSSFFVCTNPLSRKSWSEPFLHTFNFK